MYPPGKQHIPPLEKENHLPNHLWEGICEFPGGYLFIFILHGRCLYRMISGTTKAWARSCPRCGPARREPMIEKKHRRWARFCLMEKPAMYQSWCKKSYSKEKIVRWTTQVQLVTGILPGILVTRWWFLARFLFIPSDSIKMDLGKDYREYRWILQWNGTPLSLNLRRIARKVAGHWQQPKKWGYIIGTEKN